MNPSQIIEGRVSTSWLKEGKVHVNASAHSLESSWENFLELSLYCSCELVHGIGWNIGAPVTARAAGGRRMRER